MVFSSRCGKLSTIYLLGLLLTVGVVQSGAQQTTIYTISFEAGQSTNQGWRSLIVDSSCPCPTATINLGSDVAARSGTAGVLIHVTVPASQAWHVQLQSPDFNLSSAQLYTACFWVRTNVTTGVTVPMNLIKKLSGYVWVAGNSVKATTDWRQVCISNLAPASVSGIYYYVLDFGLNPGTVYVDDFTLTAVRNTVEEYVSAANVSARIETYRKGNFTLKFVNKTSGKLLTGTKLSTLKLRLARHDFPFGSAMEWDNFPAAHLSWYSSTAKKHFNALVPEYSFKWPTYEPSQGNYGYRLDYLMKKHINFAAVNDFVLARGHTLEWPNSANYGFAEHWSRQSGCDNYRTYLHERITRDVGLFKGKFQSYDVFNEVLHELQFIEDCPGMWPGILYEGFRWAAATDPTAQLCLNDYDLITGDHWQMMVDLVKDMKANGVPIHCIGVQAYVSTQNRPTPAYMKPRLDALAALNVSLLITEFNFLSYWDSQGPVWSGTEAEHAALYDEYVRFWFSYPQIKGILMWGFWDAANWIRNGGIYYTDTKPKAAAATLSNLWGVTWNTTIDGQNVSLSTGQYGPYKGFYGKYYYEATIGTKTYTGFVSFPAKTGGVQTATVKL